MVRFARLMHRPVRVLGGPTVRAACGGSLKPDLVTTQGGTGGSVMRWAYRDTRSMIAGSRCRPARGMIDHMPDAPVRLHPIEEADLDGLRRFDTDPSTRGPYLPSPFCSPRSRRRRWEEDGWLGDDSSQLAVALPDGTLAGIVSWRTIRTGGPEAGCLEIGALLFPEYRGKGLGTAAQRLLVEYLFATTLANRLQAVTDVENLAEQKALERAGFRREGIMRGLAFDRGRWHDGVLYARLRDDPA
jgi:RimJ/RimL family protein N-acetyltransferase